MQKPITITQNFSIQQVMSQFLEHNISRLVVKELSSIGIVTTKDIGLFLLTDESEKSLDDIPVSDLVNPLISGCQSTSIQEGAKIMTDKGIGCLGITSADGNLIGIVTKTDLVKYYKQNYSDHYKVRDLMTVSYVFMDSKENLLNIISKMFEEKISRVFLENKEKQLEGILTLKDLFPLAIEKGHLNTLRYNDYHNEDVAIACSKMIENNISGVGVKINNKPSGIISKTDVTKAISKIED
jgi:CBS domain-containing protein